MILLNYIFIDKKKDHTGIEPVTYRSAVDCSTTELKALNMYQPEPSDPLTTLVLSKVSRISNGFHCTAVLRS